ncbi:ACD11 homolog protein isoform X3 [Argentina anserina]|uniref:ACD11 homolog protein isoform X3 n=1 Tax=Argentina anserina TaxID=57926 RepID=UPI0021761F12|nr:ACD11 homolog protein isoform X3 [Potentilla anserina]
MVLGWRYRAAINGMAEMSKDDDDATSPAPLSSIVEAFEKLAKILDSQEQDGDLQLDTFCQACSLVSILFSCLGLAFKFAEMEYVSKVNDLSQAAVNYDTLENILDFDVANDTVKSPGSRSRNLRRVRQGLDLIRAIFENFLATELFKGGSFIGLCPSLCPIPHLGSQDSSCCWYVCSSFKGSTSDESQRNP